MSCAASGTIDNSKLADDQLSSGNVVRYCFADQTRFSSLPVIRGNTGPFPTSLIHVTLEFIVLTQPGSVVIVV